MLTRLRYRIDPKKPARETLWEMAHLAAVFAVRHRRLKLFREEFGEIVDELTMETVTYFMWRLRHGKYNRKFSLFDNVSYCTWSRAENVINRGLNFMKEKICSYDRWPGFKTNVDRKIPTYTNTCDCKRLAMANLRSWMRNDTHISAVGARAREEADEAYEARLDLFGEGYVPRPVGVKGNKKLPK